MLLQILPIIVLLLRADLQGYWLMTPLLGIVLSMLLVMFMLFMALLCLRAPRLS